MPARRLKFLVCCQSRRLAKNRPSPSQKSRKGSEPSAKQKQFPCREERGQADVRRLQVAPAKCQVEDLQRNVCSFQRTNFAVGQCLLERLLHFFARLSSVIKATPSTRTPNKAKADTQQPRRPIPSTPFETWIRSLLFRFCRLCTLRFGPWRRSRTDAVANRETKQERQQATRQPAAAGDVPFGVESCRGLWAR